MSNPKIATSETELLDDPAVCVTEQCADLVAGAEGVARAIVRGERFVVLIGEPTSTGRALTALIASIQTTAVDFVCAADSGAGVGPIRHIIDQLVRTDDDGEAWADKPALRTVLVIQQASGCAARCLKFSISARGRISAGPLLQFLFVGYRPVPALSRRHQSSGVVPATCRMYDRP